MFKLSRRGSYTGRLAFDPDTGFHVAADGRKVVTDDNGKTWRYAHHGDPSHLARYHQRSAPLSATTEDDYVAGDPAHLHHRTPDRTDAHYDDRAVGNTAPVVHPDHLAPTVTSHTDAWKAEA